MGRPAGKQRVFPSLAARYLQSSFRSVSFHSKRNCFEPSEPARYFALRRPPPWVTSARASFTGSVNASMSEEPTSNSEEPTSTNEAPPSETVFELSPPPQAAMITYTATEPARILSVSLGFIERSFHLRARLEQRDSG